MSNENNVKEKKSEDLVKKKRGVFSLYDQFFEEMERSFMDFFKIRPLGKNFWSFDSDLCCLEPLSDVQVTNKDVIVSVDLPYVKKEDIKISTTENTIEIEAKTEKAIKFDKWATEGYQKEFHLFHKTLRLPLKVNPEGAKANFKNGILVLNIPRKYEKYNVKIE
ncbi:MAG: Hsp20/alpha crystallin family protein [Candidatus Lokiarchaeota archaeon]|nr:Hsp20/alpha crystallin family protein [Candidatus Lokiarchaeota archaeon]